MTKPVVALFSPNNNSASETFIRAHRDNIAANVVFYTDGMLPTRVNDRPIMRLKYQLHYLLLKRMGMLKTLSLEEYVLSRSLRDNKPDAVLCEYGVCANASLNTIKSLGLPMLVYFHGYDISVNHVVNENNKYQDVIDYASKIFVVSRDQETRLIDYGAQKEKIIYNPCVPSEAYFTVERTAKRPELFVAAGRLTNKKAPHLTLLAFRRVLEKYPKARLVLAGEGELHQVCRDLARHYGIDDNVDLPGVFDSLQLREWFGEAAAFVQHSVTAEDGNQEGTPVVILEAMASGLPVISTRHAGIKDVIVNSQTGYLVDEYDVDSMANQMIAVLDNPANATKIGLAGREFVLNNLTMTQHIARIDQAIASCI